MSKTKSKIRYLVAATSLVALLNGGCTAAYRADSGGGTVTRVPHPVAAVGPNENVGQDIVDLLKDEFDYVTYAEICSQRNGEGKCTHYDLVIRGEEEVGGSYFTVWGINLDCVCHAYTMGRPVIDYILGRYVISDMCEGTVVSTHNMNRTTAMKLAEFLDIRTQMNGERCREWVDMIQRNYGPFGPASRHKTH